MEPGDRDREWHRNHLPVGQAHRHPPETRDLGAADFDRPTGADFQSAVRDDRSNGVQRDGLDRHSGHQGDRPQLHPVKVLASELEPLRLADNREILAFRSPSFLSRFPCEVSVPLHVGQVAVQDGKQDVAGLVRVRSPGDRPGRAREEVRRGFRLMVM
jgi:hypothetical protein